MPSTASRFGLRRAVGVGNGFGGLLFDLLFGVVLGGFVAAIPLGLLSALIGDPAHVLTALYVVAVVTGIRFMRKARAETGPAWFR